VTVIIATYDWKSVLPYSIGSVLAQTFTDWELLVVGDACRDGSEAVVQGIGDPRVRWINLPAHTGHQSGPNNEGIRQAAGELIAYLGHDDLWLAHHLAVLVAAIDRGAGLAYGITEMVAPGGAWVEPAPRGLGPYRPGQWIPPTAVVHRRAAAVAAGGWLHPHDAGVDPEAELWQRIAEGGAELAFVPRLTAVKFPASARRDVYRLRPHEEQARCLERIRIESDFEARELARMLALAQRVSWRTLVRRRWTRLRTRLWKLVGYRRGVFERRRRFKGLD